MKQAATAFIRERTRWQAVPFVPEIALHLAADVTPLWMEAETWSQQTDMAPPFWAFAWPGGMALARYVLDHPETVRGLSVLDFAAGSGLGAIAAAKAGARRIDAADIDPLAQVAVQMNASRNGVAVGGVRAVDLDRPCKGYDLILAGDVCYEQVMSARVLKWLGLSAAAGACILLSDPGRAYAPSEAWKEALQEVARYTVPVLRALEDSDERAVTLWAWRRD